jgi:hypothetical protein
MIITASSPDKFYFEQLLAFLASFEFNSPFHSHTVYLANYPGDITRNLRMAFPNTSFVNRELEAIDGRGIHFILFRINLIREIFKNRKEPVAWIDTDVIVRKKLDDFLKIEPKQLKILYRGDKKPDKVKFNAGIFRIGYSKETAKMMDDWHDGLIKNTIWGMGQLELWKAYHKNRNRVELVKMPKRFNDIGGNDRPDAFDEESVMWHSKKAHFKNPKFQKEYQHYLKMGKSAYGKVQGN